MCVGGLLAPAQRVAQAIRPRGSYMVYAEPTIIADKLGACPGTRSNRVTRTRSPDGQECEPEPTECRPTHITRCACAGLIPDESALKYARALESWECEREFTLFTYLR